MCEVHGGNFWIANLAARVSCNHAMSRLDAYIFMSNSSSFESFDREHEASSRQASQNTEIESKKKSVFDIR